MSGRGGKAPRGRAGFNSQSGGISLERFARAKKSTYDPREVKEKERARAAITVAKYKKLKKRLQRESADLTSSQPPQQQELRDARIDSDNAEDDADEHPSTAGPSRKSKDSEYANKRSKHGGERHRKDNRKEDLDEEEEATKAAAAAQREAAKQRRRNEHKLYQKKTHHGQPLMKHRIEKMLHQLEKN